MNELSAERVFEKSKIPAQAVTIRPNEYLWTRGGNRAFVVRVASSKWRAVGAGGKSVVGFGSLKLETAEHVLSTSFDFQVSSSD